MGRSLRRVKKQKPRIVKRKKKVPFKKSKVPLEISQQSKDIEAKLGLSAKWNQDDKIENNYESLGFVANVNRNYGRNARADTLEEKILAVQECDDHENGNINDEDLKAALGEMRSSGKAPPPRPTPRQRDLIDRLVSVHGNDIEAMVRDRKLNSMQQSAGQLKKLIDRCAYWSSRQAGVDFRVPNKRLW